MYVGVILCNLDAYVLHFGIPHVCGGDPAELSEITTIDMVFPMYVGVILLEGYSNNLLEGIPHVCGGDPNDGTHTYFEPTYSPCMWG